MDNKNIKKVSVLAGAMFIASFLFSVISTAMLASFHWTTLLFWASLFLMATAMFSEKYVFLAIGVGLRVPGSILSLLNNVENLIYSFDSYGRELSDIVSSLCFLLDTLLSVATVVIIIVAVFKHDKAKKLCLLAVGLNVVSFLMYVIGFIAMVWDWFDVVSIVVTLLTLLLSEVVECVPIALAGNVMQSNVPQQVSPATVVDTSDRVEKVMKLKALLDSDVISQEEFDAKKKQILGL